MVVCSRDADLERVARQIRGRLVEVSGGRGVPHLGSGLSCVDILVELYWRQLRIDPARPDEPGRDRFILSKGHAAPALYVTLAMRGFFAPELLDTLGEAGSALAEQPSPRCVPGLEAATGSLGHGLPIGVGRALAARVRGDHQSRVVVLMSDGECNEGSVWEAALMAPALALDRLVAIVDYNKWQATDRTNRILAIEPLVEKFAAFGWSSSELDGHDFGALSERLERLPDGSGRPVAIIANTVKGKGISFMEDDNNWHYRIPSRDEIEAAQLELGLIPK
jgi:transketolase